MKTKMKALIVITDVKGNKAFFTEKQILKIEIEDKRRKGILEFKLKEKK